MDNAMTDSLTGGLRLGPQDRLRLEWIGNVWRADYYKFGANGFVAVRGHKRGIPGEGAEEVCRNAIQAAQLSQET